MESQSLNVIGLISGGKDSIFNLIQCVQQGHKIIALANLYPVEMGKEIDSYMYQSVGSHAIESLAAAMEKPIYRRVIEGKPKITDLEYNGTMIEKEGDEVEDLYSLLKEIKVKKFFTLSLLFDIVFSVFLDDFIWI
jgi:diphthine-ammonia ligase